MRPRRPSPATAISLVALVFAMTGTAVAAVNYATNAGAVDGKSAVADGASRAAAAGRLVATARRGDDRGRIDQRYLDARLMRGGTAKFGRAFEVSDNQTLAPVPIGGIPGLGVLTAQCIDQDRDAGREDPLSRIVFANSSGDVVNVSRTIGAQNPEIAALPNGAQSSFDIRGSNTFELHIERKGVNYFVRGVVRQDGARTPAATCLVYGFALAVS